jgi:two-component system, NarL family, invasion response regulator UvrY
MPDILIADDHSIVRHGLALLAGKAIGDSCTIDFAQSGREALEKLQEKEYRLLLSDLMMPDQMGIALIGAAMELLPDLRVIVVSVGPEQDFAERCLQAGAAAYINKGMPDAAFIETIRTVYQGKHAENKKTIIRDAFLSNEQIRSFDELSRREREVVLLLLKGKGVLEIANMLSISASATSTLKGRAFQKLNVQSVIELSRLAYYLGLHSDGESLS